MNYSGIKIALDPSPKQQRQLNREAGAARFAYNWTIDFVSEAYENDPNYRVNFFEIRKTFNALKPILAPWWKECSSQAFANGIRDAVRSFSNFFSSLCGSRKGAYCGYPKYKNYNSRKSFHHTTGSFGPDPDNPYVIKIPRVGKIHTFQNVHKRFHAVSKIVNMTVCQEGKRWFACFTVEAEFFKRGKSTSNKIGVDLGIRTLATTSDGQTFENPKAYHKSEKKLRRLHKNLGRQKKYSNRRQTTKRKLQALHCHVCNQRVDAIQKATTCLVRNNETIILEDLKIEEMKQDKLLAKAISDAAWGEFRREIVYKGMQYGRNIVFIDTFYPSSQLCSQCGSRKADLTLQDRIYRCNQCGLIMDRDLNAAINLLKAGEIMANENSIE